MRILCISGYPAWEKVSRKEMPSHHLFGIHEMIDHYEEYDQTVRGVLKDDVLDGGYVDFYLWTGGKKNAVKHTFELLKLSKNYDVVYDMLNRCSIFLGTFRKLGIMKSKLITIMHHPPYKTQLKIADSDAYIFFDREYMKIANKDRPKKNTRYFVNNWRPDIQWYSSIPLETETKDKDCFYIDNGKSRRDRDTLIKAAEEAQIRVDYAGDIDGKDGWARSYKMDLKDDIAQLQKLRQYKAIIIPIQESKKEKIGPLGITSYLDAISLGIPVIASDNVCFANEINSNHFGLIYKTGDVYSLKNCINILYKDSNLYYRITDAIKGANYKDINDYSRRFLEIIELVLN